MRNEALKKLIKKIDAGDFSRNKHFEAYRTHEVRRAKKIQVRLQNLTRVLLRYGATITNLRLTLHVFETGCKLTLVYPELDLTWTAHLPQVEYELLAENPKIKRIFDACTIVEQPWREPKLLCV